MNRDKANDNEDLPHRDDKQMDEQARESRERLDQVPEPGTDPLHEGP
jgi:hypothetical protein